MEDEKRLICNLCNLALVDADIDFTYLGHTFKADGQRCPGCGQVYLSDALVKGRVAEVETALEDK